MSMSHLICSSGHARLEPAQLYVRLNPKGINTYVKEEKALLKIGKYFGKVPEASPTMNDSVENTGVK